MYKSICWKYPLLTLHVQVKLLEVSSVNITVYKSNCWKYPVLTLHVQVILLEVSSVNITCTSHTAGSIHC